MRLAQHTTINIEEYRNQVGTAFHSEYRSIQTKVNTLPSSTTKNSLKKAQGCAEGRGLAPLCGFLTFQCDPTLCGVPQSMWHTQPSFRNTCGYTAGIPQSMCHIRPEFRSLCGYTAGASAAYALIISPYKI